jgi:hypothetical protein
MRDMVVARQMSMHPPSRGFDRSADGFRAGAREVVRFGRREDGLSGAGAGVVDPERAA